MNKASDLKLDLTLTLGYLNPALNNAARSNYINSTIRAPLPTELRRKPSTWEYLVTALGCTFLNAVEAWIFQASFL